MIMKGELETNLKTFAQIGFILNYLNFFNYKILKFFMTVLRN